MHKLNRQAVTEPPNLVMYRYPAHKWDDLEQCHKEEVRDQLIAMQGRRCAYCEGDVWAYGHIEHFRRKNPMHFPQLTFDWQNLFYACGSADHCGHYKDRPGGDGYNPDHLIKPDDDDPDDYLYFHSLGNVDPRSGIDAGGQAKAAETIRVFNLDCGTLRGLRRRAVKLYLNKDPDILEALMEFDEADRGVFIEIEMNASRNQAHSTVIKHFFEKAY